MNLPRHFVTFAACAVSLAIASERVSAAADAHDTYSTKILVDSGTALCSLIKPTARTQLHRAIESASSVVEESVARQNRVSPDEILLLQDETKTQRFIEVIGGSAAAVDARVLELCPESVQATASERGLHTNGRERARHLRGTANTSSLAASDAAPVIRKIVDSGAPSNRIDIVFMGDGYTLDEEARFFADIERLTHDMFTGDTFAQYLPLFNVWAAFVPSVESGIGVGGQPRDTAFGLYRDGTELRGVYAAKPEHAREVCAAVGEYACDFPSLIGNDDFYGGLGGEFVISTRSATSGTIVLRHEMGHNFGNVGEEYDGGTVYSGANSVATLANVTWQHWLTEPTKLVEQQAAQLFQQHIWHDLEEQGSYTIAFTSTGAYNRSYIRLSVSGADTDDSLAVTLDGAPLPWTSSGLQDRTFYVWTNATSGFAAGAHTLTVTAGTSSGTSVGGAGSIRKQLCNAVVYEYKDERTFKLDDADYIGLYPTFDVDKNKMYRPSNDKCLMRNMQSTSFCRVCQENMWLRFLARVEVIDAVVVDAAAGTACVHLLALAQLRTATDGFVRANAAVARAERYTVQWLRNGTEALAFRDQLRANVTTGDWTVRASFWTPNVRLDSTNVLQSERNFTVA